MNWTGKRRQIAEVILKHQKDDGYDFKACQTELEGTAKSAISTVAKALRESNWQIPQLGKDGSKVEIEKPESVAGLKVRNPPVIFEVRGEKVTLSPEDLYEGYFIYLDMKTRAGIDNTFSDTLKAGVETLWSLSVRPVVTEGGEIKVA